jgi:hypothetical protein
MESKVVAFKLRTVNELLGKNFDGNVPAEHAAPSGAGSGAANALMSPATTLQKCLCCI